MVRYPTHVLDTHQYVVRMRTRFPLNPDPLIISIPVLKGPWSYPAIATKVVGIAGIGLVHRHSDLCLSLSSLSAPVYTG